MTSDAQLNRPLGSPLALHKRQVDLLDTSAERSNSAIDTQNSSASPSKLMRPLTIVFR